jgi:hypothetical protein
MVHDFTIVKDAKSIPKAIVRVSEPSVHYDVSLNFFTLEESTMGSVLFPTDSSYARESSLDAPVSSSAEGYNPSRKSIAPRPSVQTPTKPAQKANLPAQGGLHYAVDYVPSENQGDAIPEWEKKPNALYREGSSGEL